MTVATSEKFLMPIQDIFSIKGTSGFLLVGPVQRGTLQKGQVVEIIGLNMPSLKVKADELTKAGTGITLPGLKEINAGDYGGIFLPNSYRNRIKRGMAVVWPGSLSPHVAVRSQFRLHNANEGGRSDPIILVFNHEAAYPSYSAQFYVYGMDFDCVMGYPCPEKLDYFELHPGDTADLLFCFLTHVPVEEGMSFRLRRGYQVIGSGLISTVLDDCSQ